MKRKPGYPPGMKKLENGKFRVDVRIHAGPRGRIIRILKDEDDAYDLAIHLNEEKRSRKRQKEGIEKSRPIRIRIADVIEKNRREKEKLARKTYTRYKPVFEQFMVFVDWLEIRYMDEFTRQHANMYLERLEAEKPDPRHPNKLWTPHPRTVNIHLGTIKGIFEKAWYNGDIEINPFAAIEKRKVDKHEDLPKYFTTEELRALFSVEMSPYYRRFYIGLLFTGCRFNELASLTWSNVDLKNKLIHVQRSERFRGKNPESYRSIPLLPELEAILDEIEDDRIPDNYVFTTEYGYKMRSNRALEKLKLYAGKAGLPLKKVRIHSFRHTYATLLIQHGAPIAEISALLGHRDVKHTQIYAKLAPSKLHRTAGLLSGIDWGNDEDEDSTA